MDLNGDGFHFTSIQNSNVAMDVNNDGVADKMAWASNEDGVLVWDKDQNQQITDASEIGFQKLKADAQTDLEGLQALDTNGNGLLDAGDAKFTEFAVWQDANGNGVTDAGEFKTLNYLGIESINLHSNAQMRDETDVTIMGEAAFTRSDGTVGVLVDAMFAFQPGQVQQSLEQAEINRMALLFNQVVNTAVDVPTQGLGCVPIEADVLMMNSLLFEDEHNKTFLTVT